VLAQAAAPRAVAVRPDAVRVRATEHGPNRTGNRPSGTDAGPINIIGPAGVTSGIGRAAGVIERRRCLPVTDGFHPDLPSGQPNLRHVRSGELDPDTAQTAGMQRLAAISNRTVGSQRLWMGRTHVGPASRSGDHHHGEAETAIYVVSGTPEFVFLDEHTGEETRIRAGAGDFVFVPPYTPHREENNDPATEAVVVIARSTQEAIVVNLASLAEG
jgi:uncharacterized RmlC-like cupin family protein